jgi:hypothetical protein
MWRYFKAASLASVDLPTLGRVRLNLLALAAILVTGFFVPHVWLIGLGLEAVFFLALLSSARFRNSVRKQQPLPADLEHKRDELVRSLKASVRRRVLDLDKECQKIIAALRTRQTDEYTIVALHDSLNQLQWAYLKLLIARQNFEALGDQESEPELQQEIAALEAKLHSPGDQDALRESQAATLDILKQRLANFQRKHQSLAEIDSDLARIEAQVQLNLENATIEAQPHAVSADIALASDLAGGTLYGDSKGVVADLDQAYGKAQIAPSSAKAGITDGQR